MDHHHVHSNVHANTLFLHHPHNIPNNIQVGGCIPPHHGSMIINGHHHHPLRDPLIIYGHSQHHQSFNSHSATICGPVQSGIHGGGNISGTNAHTTINGHGSYGGKHVSVAGDVTLDNFPGGHSTTTHGKIYVCGNNGTVLTIGHTGHNTSTSNVNISGTIHW